MTNTHILGDNVPRKSNFDPDLARKITKYYEEHPEELKKEKPKKYILMPHQSAYALGVLALQEACMRENNQNQPKFTFPEGKEIYRSNTFLENILARINDYNTVNNPDGTLRSMRDRSSFFLTGLDSCCGVAYKAETTKLKLNLQCPELIGIDENVGRSFLPVDYASFPHQIELDSSSPNFTRDGWMALLEGRTEVYTDYLNLLTKMRGEETVPQIWTFSKNKVNTDELRTVYVNDMISLSFAFARDDFDKFGRFLRREP